NNWYLAIITMGEGWHNNHHHFMGSTRQGFFWWEVDLTYYILRFFALLGLVWDIKEPPQRVYDPKTWKSAAKPALESERAVSIPAPDPTPGE
ncbi:MAG TPA: acyl-CoA desaturase, partial [Polyangiaceae bacterium]